MSFLAPLFFVGLATLAIPVLVHLVQRERKRVVEFPSLMFVQRIPYKSVRRRRIRHWFLLALRAAAIAAIIAAFARPFLPRGAGAIAAAGGSREIVILLDRSASMGFGDHFERARAAAIDVVRSMSASDKATLVTFGRNAEERLRSSSDRGRLEAAIGSVTPSASATRYGPALKLAESVLGRSTLPRHEIVLISDFQKSGWSGAEDVRLGEQVRLTPVSVATERAINLSVPQVTFARATFSGQERVTVTAGVANRSGEAASDVPVSLEIEGHEIEGKRASVAPNASTSVTFAPFTLAEPTMRGAVKVGTDKLTADNQFTFVVTPETPLAVLVVDNGDQADASFYLKKALGIGASPAFQVETVPAARVSPAMLEKRSVVILNDTMLPPGLAGSALNDFVERGGGLLIATGDKTAWPASEGSLLPGALGAPVDRLSGRGGTLGYLDYSHPAFEVFKAPRSGDFSAARVLRYRTIEVTPTDRVLARFDDGAVAAAERRLGNGRVVLFGTTLDDSWTDLALKPVYLPLIHQLVKYLAQYEAAAAWRTVDSVVDVSAWLKGRADRVVLTPSGERRTLSASEPGLLELTELGVYEIRSAANTAARPDRIAVNLDPAESDLTTLDPTELVAAVTGRAAVASGAADAAVEVPAEEAERQQSLWWYLLIAGLLLLAAELAISNRLSRTERFL